MWLAEHLFGEFSTIIEIYMFVRTQYMSGENYILLIVTIIVCHKWQMHVV